ncbi:hypothetical protein N8747_00445 [Candidatus Pelagibacter sp.]|nr:hypothetical protein [Candidatus Pelagibacter sp.]
MKKIILIFFNTLALFILINFLISISWPVYTSFTKIKHNFTDEQIDILGLPNEELNILYKETWKNYDKFRFLPFVGHTETVIKGKYVNFNEEEGRKIIRPSSCNSNIYLYGGSTTFGYNVTDKETIGQHLQNKMGNDYCVYNHGRSYFYSKQENNLFSLQLENKNKIDFAIFIDGINERCGSYEYANDIYNYFSTRVEKPYKIWGKTFVNFLYSLPIIHLHNKFFNHSKWVNDDNNNILEITSCKKKIPLNELFQSRVNLRHALCKEENIKCLSLVQPMPGTNGVQIEKFLENEKKLKFIEKKELLLKANKYTIDIGDVLNNDKKLSYIDGVHYTPESNKKIAERISLLLNNL